VKTGQELKEQGMARALSPDPLTVWKADFKDVALTFAQTGVTFTSEDVLDLVGLPSGSIKSNANNAVGAMMNGLARTGVIGKTGDRRPSKRPSSHGAELTVWVGLRASETDETTHPADPAPVPPADNCRCCGAPLTTFCWPSQIPDTRACTYCGWNAPYGHNLSKAEYDALHTDTLFDGLQ
jgi:hypothetical protein